MEQLYNKDILSEYIRQITNDEIKDEVALEGFFGNVFDEIVSFTNWLGENVENTISATLDAISSKHGYAILGSSRRKTLVNNVSILRLTHHTKLLMSVPPGLERDFLGYARAVSNGLLMADERVFILMDAIEVLLSSVASGNEMTGIHSIKSRVEIMNENKNNYTTETSKFVGGGKNTKLFLPQVYNSPKDALEAFDLLKSKHDILKPSSSRILARQSRKMSSIFKIIDKTKLSKGEVISLLTILEGGVNALQFAGLVMTDAYTAIAAMDSHVSDFQDANEEEI